MAILTMQLDRSPFYVNKSAREMAADISLGDLSGCRLSSGLLSGDSYATQESFSGNYHPDCPIQAAQPRRSTTNSRHLEGGWV